MTRIALAVACLALGLPALAEADDLPPPPESCPAGSTPHSEHAGQWCAATTCESDAECTAAAQRSRGVSVPEGQRYACRPSPLCVRHESYPLGGLRAEPATAERDVALGPCVRGACPGEGSCVSARRCVRADAPVRPAETPPDTAPEDPPATAEPDEPPASGSGGCAVGGSVDSGLGALLLLGLAVAGWRRRRA